VKCRSEIKISIKNLNCKRISDSEIKYLPKTVKNPTAFVTVSKVSENITFFFVISEFQGRFTVPDALKLRTLTFEKIFEN